MPSSFLSVLLALAVILPSALAVERPLPPLTYNDGAILTGNVDIAILWYGNVTKVQRNKILAFIKSINGAASATPPSVATWWHMVESYQKFANKPVAPINVQVVSQKDDPDYSQGKVLIKDMIITLLPTITGGNNNLLALIVTSDGVTAKDMCAGNCWQHGSVTINDKPYAYVLVGNPESECPICAWPFMPDVHAPEGSPVLMPPSSNLAADAMVMSLAGGLMGAVTNPHGDGFHAEHRGEQLDATLSCKGIFGSGAAPGNPGKVLLDPRNYGSYNAQGNGLHKFLLPAVWNPETKSCWTLL